MPRPPLHILPFEGLIKSLRLQGFPIGVDTHLHIQTLLNTWQSSDKKDLETLKIQLGVILARDPEEQERFYRLFDAYVDRFSYDPSIRKQKTATRSTTWWERNKFKLIFGVLGLGLMLGTGYGWLESQKGITRGFAYQQQPGTNKVWLEDQSEVFSFPPFWEDSIIERKWLIDGKLIGESELAEAEFSEPGTHEIHLVLTSQHTTDTLFENILLKRVCVANFAFSPKGRTRTFTLNIIRPQPDTSNSPILRRRLINLPLVSPSYRFQWDFGDNSPEENDSIVTHTFEPGSYAVSLRVFDAQTGKPITTASQRIVVEQTESPVNVQPVSIGYRELEWEEEVLELLKPEKAPTWPYWLTALILALYGLYEWYLSLTRRPILDSSRERGAPSHQELKLDRPTTRLFESEVFDEAALKLRARKQGEAFDLDLEGTVQATIDAGGLPEFAWKHSEEAPQYVFLIEQQSHEDQLATYYSELVWELHDRDISAEFFFYDEEVHFCWKDRSRPDTEIELGRLASEYGNYRLVVIGSGKSLIDPFDNGLHPDTKTFLSWRQRAFLSTVPTEGWAWTEQVLERIFPLLPANELGLSLVVDHWEEGIPTGRMNWQHSFPEPEPPRADSPYLLDELKAYLGESGFQWLCTCAVYPELYWELTLGYGEIIADDHQIPMGKLPLLRLLQLSWLRIGKFPREIRLELYEALEPHLAKSVRNHLIQVLEQQQNRAPENSYARQQQETTLAIYQYMNSDQEAEALEALSTQLGEIDPHSIKDVVSLQQVSSIKANPLAIVLPRRFFKGGIPLFGTRGLTRVGLVLLPLLFFWGIYWLIPKPSEQIEMTHPYPIEAFALTTNPKDTARYWVYEGYWTYKNGDWDEAEKVFIKIRDKMSSLAENQESADREGLVSKYWWQAKRNLSKLRFHRAQKRYLKQEFRQASIGFESSYPSIYKTVGEKITYDGGHYAAGLAHLYTVNTDTALIRLLVPGEEWYNDTTTTDKNLFTEQLPESQTRLVQQLTKLYNAQSVVTQSRIDQLLGWLGEEAPEIPRLLDEADSLFNKGQYKAALDKYEQILLQEPDNDYALAQQQLCQEFIKNAIYQVLIDHADQLFKMKNWGSSKEAYSSVLDFAPEDSYAQRQIQRCDSAMAAWTTPPAERTETRNEDSLKVPDGEDSLLIISPKNDTIPEYPSPKAFIPGIIDPDFQPTKMVEVQGGSFLMGSPEDDNKATPDEKPQHQVTLDTYWIDEHEVTNQQYAAFLNEMGNQKEGGTEWIYLDGKFMSVICGIIFEDNRFSARSGSENHPVIYVSWYGAKAYADWLSKKTGLNYRLPTEAQCEYAARGGQKSRGYTYSGGNSLRPVGWFLGNSKYSTEPVKEKRANELELYDMSGNVWEWCSDWYGRDYYEVCKYQGTVSNPQGPESGSARVIRGGSWLNSSGFCRVANRGNNSPANRGNYLGFRLAR